MKALSQMATYLVLFHTLIFCVSQDALEGKVQELKNE